MTHSARRRARARGTRPTALRSSGNATSTFTGATDAGSTSVIISGLTPGTPYVIHGNWSAIGFPFATDCTSSSLCMTVTVDDLQAGCGALPVETKTWGGVKSLYKN